jgi:hypothetical protein
VSSLLQPTSVRSWNVLSTEPWFTQVNAQVPGSSTPENVSADPVKYAFKPSGVAPDTPPSGSDWTSGSWTTVTQGTNTIYLAYITVGPTGTVTLPAGTYTVWIYLDDALGIPVAPVGTLTITNL